MQTYRHSLASQAQGIVVLGLMCRSVFYIKIHKIHRETKVQKINFSKDLGVSLPEAVSLPVT